MRKTAVNVMVLVAAGLSGCHESTPRTDAGTDAATAVDASGSDAGATADGGRDTRCDEGELLCNALPPTCGALEVAAVQGGCWECVNAITCRPWGEPGCETDMTCPADERCNPCATGSCAGCEDCVAGCVPHGCPTETTLTCRCARPVCPEGSVSVIREGCWICVTLDSCSVVRDSC